MKLILNLAFAICIAAAAFGTDSQGLNFQIKDTATGSPFISKLIDNGDGSKSPQVHLDAALDVGAATLNLSLTDVTALPGATPTPSPASALQVQGYLTGIPIPTTEKKLVSTTKLAANYSASHITTKTTTTPTSSTAYVSAIAICVTDAGTTETLVIKNKEGTPKTIYTAGTAVAAGNTYISFPEPIIMTSGIDIVTGGTTAGVVDVFITYWQ